MKSKRSKNKNKTKKKIKNKGGSKIYTDGTIETIDTPGVPFFRKMYNDKTDEQHYLKKVETEIVKILMKHPHPNIVTYYDITDKYVDMEELQPIDSTDVQEIMRGVKDFLQGLGIMYIDWKFDNIGKSADGTYKLFDFDASGLIDSKGWVLEPVPFWSYKKARQNASLPKEIDDWSFEYNIGKKN